MPTITQLPPLVDVTPADAIPVSQGGATHSVSVGTLLESMQPAIMSDPGTLLGRVSLGAGGPEPIIVGAGLLLNDGTLATSAFNVANILEKSIISSTDGVILRSDGTLAALPASSLRSLFTAGTNISIDANGTISVSNADADSYSVAKLAPAAVVASSDLVAISQGGTDRAISYANLLDGLTIEQAQPAVPTMDTDVLWVAQGSSTMLRQTFAAIWAWVASKQPSYKMPVAELTANTTLDGTVHNGRMLICSQAITLSPAPANMGAGFHCDVLNLSGGNVTFGSGIITSSGSSILPNSQAATMRVASYSGGTVVFASLAGSSGGSGDATAQPVPGQVAGLSAGNPTSSAITLTWSAPSSGGVVSSYTVQFRVTDNVTWSTFATGITGTNATVTGLVASTAYQFRVYAVNAGGSGQPSPSTSANTVATSGNVVSISWSMVPVGAYDHGSGTIGVNAHVCPASAAVRFGFSTSSIVQPTSWTDATHVNGDLWGAYVSTPPVAGMWYAWVSGVDGSLPTAYAATFMVI